METEIGLRVYNIWCNAVLHTGLVLWLELDKYQTRNPQCYLWGILEVNRNRIWSFSSRNMFEDRMNCPLKVNSQASLQRDCRKTKESQQFSLDKRIPGLIKLRSLNVWYKGFKFIWRQDIYRSPCTAQNSGLGFGMRFYMYMIELKKYAIESQ